MNLMSLDATPAELPRQQALPVVLVVDDAPETLRMLCDALVLEGYEVLAARDALEALERFEVTVPDGVLLDAVMPGRDGFDLCSQIKATPAWAHVPVLFMTGLSETDHIIRGFACGGVDYVVKPLRLPEVMARLATHVRNARVARMAQEAVDIAGMGTVLLDYQGRVAWRSPQATQWLDMAFGADDGGKEQAAQWLLQVLRDLETVAVRFGREAHHGHSARRADELGHGVCFFGHGGVVVRVSESGNGAAQLAGRQDFRQHHG